MSEQNRVGPDGRIVATDVRGAWMGNRGGPLHPNDGRHEIVRSSVTARWITCRLSFRGRRVEQWAPGRYTPLFFRDEAVAFAAGHRPCAECRRADFNTYRTAWGAGGAVPSAAELDARLHVERVNTHRAAWSKLPTGVFVIQVDGFALVVDDHLVAWDAARYGYGARRDRPTSGYAEVLTPVSTVAVLRAGYPVQLDAAAR